MEHEQPIVVVQNPADEPQAPQLPPPPPEIVWLYDHDCQNKEELRLFLTEVEENVWSKLKDVDTKNGKKSVYRCNRAKRRGTQCSAGLYTLSNKQPNDVTISVYRKNLPHDHDDLENKTIDPVSDVVKRHIIDLYKRNRLPPKSILYDIKNDENLPQNVSITQVYNVIRIYKRKEFGDTGVTLNDLTSARRR